MAGIGWALAAHLSTPQFYVFHTNYVTTPGKFQNMTLCESIWRDRPLIERRVRDIVLTDSLIISSTVNVQITVETSTRWFTMSFCLDNGKQNDFFYPIHKAKVFRSNNF